MSTEEPKEKQPLQVKQQETLVPCELVPPVAESLPKVEPETVPDVVDEGFIMVCHPQPPIAVTSVDSLFTRDKPLQVETAAELIREGQEPLSAEEKDVTVESPLGSQHEPASEGMLASDESPVLVKEAPIQSRHAVEFELKQEAFVLEGGSQTGSSLLLDQPKKETVDSSVTDTTTKDVGITCHPPVDMDVQTKFSLQSVNEVVLPSAAKEEVPAEVAVQTVGHTWTSPATEVQKNKIHVSKKTTEDEETIEIATKAGVGGGESLIVPAEPGEKYGDTGDELLVEVKYKGKGQEDNQPVTSVSELNIVHTAPQSFETVLIDPGQITTEVIVDKDGNQKIIVRKVRHTVISQQQQHTVQQSFQTCTASDIGSENAEVPVTESIAFSEVTLQGQQSTVSESQGDGKLHVTTTKSYTGKVAAGVPGGDVAYSEFSTKPQHQTVTYHAVSGEMEYLPTSVFLRGTGTQEIAGDGYVVVEPSEADIVSEPEHVVKPQPEQEGTAGDQLITTSASSVHTVVQQVTRRIVRRIRRVVRKVVVIDGKEHVTEEVVEEPEEVDEEVPRVRVHISRTENVDVGQKVLDHDLQTQYQLYSPGDKPVQEDPGFVPGALHTVHVQEGLDTCGSVFLDLDGKPTAEPQDVHMVEQHKLSKVQGEHAEVRMDVQMPLEKQEYVQGELMSAPESVHEQEAVTAEKGEVSRTFVGTSEEVIVPRTHDVKILPAVNEEVKDVVDRKLPDISEPPLSQDTQIVEDHKVVPETCVEDTSSPESNSHLAVPEFDKSSAEFDKDSAVIAGEELSIEKETFGDVAHNISEQDELHIVTGTEEILSEPSSAFDSVAMKFMEVEPKTELGSRLTKLTDVADSDIQQHVKEQDSERQLGRPESPHLVHYKAIVTGVETVPHIPTEASFVISPAMESCILSKLKETQPTQESDSQKAVTELQDQCTSLHFPGTEKDFYVQTQETGKNVGEDMAQSSELPEGYGTVDKVTFEDAVEFRSIEKPHTTIEDTVVTVSEPELSRAFDTRSTEVPEGDEGVVKSITPSPKPNEYQETVAKSDSRVCQDVTSQTSPEQGVKTIEFVLSVEEKDKPSLQETLEVIPKVSATVKVEEKEFGAASEDKRDEPSSVTLPQHEIVKEDFAIQLPGTKTMSHSLTEEIIATSARHLPTPLKTESEPSEEKTSKSETEVSTSKKSRRRKKHKGKGLGESSSEAYVEAEHTTPPSEETPDIISHDIKLDIHEGQVSVETSLAESMEIVIPGSPASTSSDMTKPTKQEIKMFETPISPHSAGYSERTHDTGYDPEDKTTLDEASILEEDDKQRNKKKKKRKQKGNMKGPKESSSVIPKSSAELVADQTTDSTDLSSTEKHDFEQSVEMETELHFPEPDETSTPTNDSTAGKVTTEGVPVERKGRKRKKDKSEPETAFEFREPDAALNLQIADTQSPEICDESHKELQLQGVDSVKIMEEGVPTRPPSGAVVVLGDSHPKPVEIWELLHMQEHSTQTVTPDIPKSPDTVTVESCIQTSMEHVPVTQEDGVQTVTTEVPTQEKSEITDFSVQTQKEELVSTQEESAQTKTPEVVEREAVFTETSIQTLEIEPLPTHEKTAQTLTPEPMQPIAVETVDSSVQVKSEEILPVREGSVQTLTPEVPVAYTKDTSIQTLKDELTPVHEESMQTVTPEPAEIPESLDLKRNEMSVQTLKEEITPVCEESAQTVPAEKLFETVEVPSQMVKEYTVQTQEGTAQTIFSPEVTEISQVATSETSIQTTKEDIIPPTDEYSQTVSPGVPHVEKIEISDISTQTPKVLVLPTQEEYAQTLSPEGPAVPETLTQAPKEENIPVEEQYSATLTAADTSIKTKEAIAISEELSHKLPSVLSEPEDSTVLRGLLAPEWTEVTDIGHPGEDDIPVQDLPETTLSHVLFIPVDTKVETAETSIQTKPVIVKEYGDERSQSSSSEEPYEIHVQTSVSFTPSLESGDVWRTNYDTDTLGASEGRKPRTPGDSFVSTVCETKEDGNVCSTAEMPLMSDVKSAQVTRNVFNMPGVEMEPVVDLAIKTEENIKPGISVRDLSPIEPKEDVKKVIGDFLSSEIGTELKDRESRQQIVKLVESTVERERTVTKQKYAEPEKEKHQPSKDRKSKHKKKPKKVQVSETGNVSDPLSSGYQEQTVPSENIREPAVLGETLPVTEVSYEEDVPQFKPENIKTKIAFEKYAVWTEDKVVIPSEPEIMADEKPQLPEVCADKKSKKGSEVLESPADTKFVTGAEFSVETQALEHMSDEEVPPELKPSYSAVAKLLPKPGVHVEAAFLTEERKVSGQPVRGEHSPGPPIKHETMATEHSPDLSSDQELKLTAHEPDAASVTEQFLIDSREYPADTTVESDLTHAKEISMENFDITEKTQGKPITVSSQDVTPVPTSKESELVIQEPSTEPQEPHLRDAELEMELPDVISRSMADSNIHEEIQDKPVTVTSQVVTPVIITSEELQFVLQEPSTEVQEPHISDNEHEMEPSTCKSPVITEDISIQLVPSRPSDIISIPVEESTTVKWKKASNILSERVRNLQNARKTTHLSGVLYLATLQEVVTEEPLEEKNVHVQHNLSLLRSAVENKDVVIIQRTIITTVETISTWLETIEYRVCLNRQKTDTAPTQEQMKEYGTLKAEIINIVESVDALESVLETASGICNEDDKIRMKECLASLQEHVKAVEEIAQESEEKVAKDLICWEEFLNGVNNISVMVEQLKQQFEELIQSDISAQSKLQELENIETVNCCHMLKTSCLLKTARKLITDFPGREIPPETYTAHETTRVIEHSVALERERLLQLLSLADDYVQTLKEFSQIIDVADTLVDSPISVISLEHLQEEMQKHRKFFVNLSHCRGILESLEGNLDPETRASHSELHQTLHCRATAILDKAASRAQQMALAASRWTVLEQGMKEERGWLQVAHQRVPDLQTVNSSDYDQYISLYQVSAINMVKQVIKNGVTSVAILCKHSCLAVLNLLIG